MARPARNLYDILGVPRQCSFEALRKAYYRRAKECHPDLYGGNSAKEEEFKRVVSAFDILSDPVTRKEYDYRLAQDEAPPEPASFRREDGFSIMDTLADDILEELVVGNRVPRGTTLQTLMRDLTRTKRFVAFREAKYHVAKGRVKQATKILRRLVRLSPQNILYHYYYAECARHLGRDYRARRHYHMCLRIGLRRLPPQRLKHIRSRLRRLLEQQGAVGKFLARFTPSPPPDHISWRDQMTGQLRRHVRSGMKRKGQTYHKPLSPGDRSQCRQRLASRRDDETS